MLKVLILSPQGALFNGSASRVILPGEQGIFEVNRFHRPTVSRLLSGTIQVDQEVFTIRRGVVKVENDSVISLVESEQEARTHGS